MNRKSCRGCVHLRKISYSNECAPYVCHYLLDTNKPRPCKAEKCSVKTSEPVFSAMEIDEVLKIHRAAKKIPRAALNLCLGPYALRGRA